MCISYAACVGGLFKKERKFMMYSLFAAAYGVLMTMQSAFGAKLTASYGNWFATVTVHLVGLITLTPSFLSKWGRRKGKSPWYLHLGGAIGVTNVVATNYAISIVGMTNSAVLMLLGEIVFAAVMDAFGLLGARKRPVTKLKWVAIAIMLAGCASISLLSGAAGGALNFLAIAASVYRGVTLVLSRQLNGRLAVQSGTGFSTYFNYLSGFVCAFAVFAFLRFPMTAAFPQASVPIWAYCGGIVGCLGIVLCNLSSPKLSALNMSLIVFIAETLSGIVVDVLIGKISVPILVGCAVVSVGMVVNLLSEKQAA